MGLGDIKMIIKTTKELNKAYPSDAAFDIEADKGTVVRALDRELISTGLRLAIPEGYCGIIKSRSGLSVKNGIEVGAGVIDANYRGEVKVHLFNHTEENFYINTGDRIAQLMIVPVPTVEWELSDDLDYTDRSDNGIGSTGV